ncbi:CrcB family protein [Haladaptatus sp. F3-133]|jgi:CrcB protein|uniref:Fluoride-specific ion channel FluC n=1 Tax=Halorutilus salinus TaxID=2487751 RepID=A0A9Q4GG62_9EURY|nr:CrcB family protein [Halorutilus salinus]MCX2818362.1 CrcB family protein [Halorutilus salinus]
MTIEPLLVALGGSLGAPARYAVGTLTTDTRIPVSTLGVNVLGSFLLGVVTFGIASDTVALTVGVGACGAFTTFSSFSYETVEALRDDPVAGTANAVLSLVLSVSAVGVAYLAVAPV